MTAASATSPTPRAPPGTTSPGPSSDAGSRHGPRGEWFEERTSSENLCRGGAAFATRYAVDLGSRLEIRIPVSPSPGESDAEFSTQGRIVHLAPGRSDRELIVGVEFTGPRFHRMFVSEATS